ncbi:hypothetical protein [Hyalangium versicolor]|uniref:hypothetical protein n=1 Tax=Hyalangium versicolor TaxID=2861190 RepID=UPI001CC96E9F|nr:hypothetical protein [Hyalangium versicolor]
MKLAQLALLSCLLLPGVSAAQRRVTAPVDIAFGPAAFLFFGPVFEDQPIHTGLKISVEAVLDKEWLQAHKNLFPQRQRGRVLAMNEVRYAPAILKLIPDSIIISPKYRNTSMYGATWKPLGFGLGLTPSPVRLSLDAGLIVTYAYLSSDTLENTHFFRPGAQLNADLEFQLSKTFLVSIGWNSSLYIPQRVGTFTETKPINESIFHVGQAYLLLHFRVPFTATM